MQSEKYKKDIEMLSDSIEVQPPPADVYMDGGGIRELEKDDKIAITKSNVYRINTKIAIGNNIIPKQ